jgi:aspartyl-tRNA synthetase
MFASRAEPFDEIHERRRIQNEETQAEEVESRPSARVLDLCRPSSRDIFRVRAMILRTFREVLEGLGFIEIHTPKLQPAATESSAELFEMDYYGRTASLARSSQLAGQMAIAAGFRKVYEVRRQQ